MQKSTKLHERNQRTSKYKWRDTSCSQIERFTIDKILILPDLIYRFKAIPINFPGSYFVDINTHILNFCRGQKI